MATTDLHALNQRYVRLTDRCRSQWTFYQLLQGLFKHLRNEVCPLDLDFPALFNELRELAASIGLPEAARTEKSIQQLSAKLDSCGKRLRELDDTVPPSAMRRFFDRLNTQDEKVLLALAKFYLDGETKQPDSLDKLDIIFTRLAEISKSGGGVLPREKHEIERLVQPLLAGRPTATSVDAEVAILLSALADLRAEIQACRSFTELAAGGALDRFRTLKRRLGEGLLNPRLLPTLMQTTVAIKSRFHELWEEERTRLQDDTNRVKDLERQLQTHPEMVDEPLRQALALFASAQERFDRGLQEESVRREDALELRQSLNRILERFETPMGYNVNDIRSSSDPDAVAVGAGEAGPEELGEPEAVGLSVDPLVQEYLSKIIFAVELVGRDRPAGEIAQAKELATLRLEPSEVEALQALMRQRAVAGTLADERARLLVQAAALRSRMDEESREIDRLQKQGSEHLADLLERASQSLQRAAELGRRFDWFIDDALYRGEMEHMEQLHRCRFRLLHAHSGLWLNHNERGGVSPF
ncbi:MAG TPA: hypothetical protein PLS53_07105 [Thermoanaerobaculaceae bacterium]|mgnify:CR=1 FL=1|nr:hypothetical protein [Thermoanaerobaculaceae bacterium]HPS77904.1 hypothetical protein [Thermoanaerobaculaceae bacterium]